MVAVPTLMPDTLPTVFTNAIAGLLLVHIPPGSVFESMVALPSHICVIPAMFDGVGFTVIMAIDIHPVASLYVMIAVAPVTPVMIPVDEPARAMVPLLLLQVPPGVLLLNVVVEPAQNTIVPVIASGIGFTVTVVVRWQPVLNL
jgi:hypothetical protein